jgi:nitrogen fixation protein FixH
MKHFAQLARGFSSLRALLAVLSWTGCDSDEAATATPAATALTVTATLTPDPPTTGQNAMSVTVKDAAGAPVAGCAVTVDPQMPMMGHGSSETAVVTDNGDGTYAATPVTLQMPGEWVITVTATKGEATGSATVTVTVQ